MIDASLLELDAALRRAVARRAFGQAQTLLDSYCALLRKILERNPADGGTAEAAMALFVWVRRSTLAARAHLSAQSADNNATASYLHRVPPTLGSYWELRG